MHNLHSEDKRRDGGNRKAETEGKTWADAMTAVEAAAKDACARRRPSPPSVPGIPCVFFIGTPNGAAFTSSRGCGGGGWMGCTVGRLADIFLQGFGRF